MMKHLDILNSLGHCTIVSAATRPVGMGWNTKTIKNLEDRGFSLKLREEGSPQKTGMQWIGLIYACLCKGLRMNRAFGHSNPYHRYAFPSQWWKNVTCDADIAVINYSYWSWLPTTCPKVVVLLDLFSGFMWGGGLKETEDLRTADLVVVISIDEEQELHRRGIKNVLWSPPLVKPGNFTLSEKIGIVGSANSLNQEGIKWLGTPPPSGTIRIKIYGVLSDFVSWPTAEKVNSYTDPYQPYQDCGIILIPTALGTGVQIKVIEALACGRVIIARRGAMRGIPDSREAWIEVESPSEMWAHAEKYAHDSGSRYIQAQKAREYYKKYLNHEHIHNNLCKAYSNLANRSYL